MIIKYKGYQVATAANGIEAVAAVRMQPFDLVLMDIKMPNKNGVEALREMKILRAQIRVMLMTAYAVDGLIEEALALGVCDIAYKPLDIPHLIAVLEKVTGVES